MSERPLHRWRSAGLLKPGEHFRRKFPSPNSPLLYHLERCEEAMNHACAHPWQQLERAPQCSRENLKRRKGSPSRLALPPTAHRAPKGQASQDAQTLINSIINASLGAAAEQRHWLLWG